MNHLQLHDQHALVEPTVIQKYTQQLQQEIQQLHIAITKQYEDSHASLNLITDQTMITHIKKLKQAKQNLNPRCIIVIGIGGSNLGTIAVQEAVYGKQHNLKNPPTNILYADTIDVDKLSDITTLFELILQNQENILIVLVSKSGGTTETIVNYEIILNTLKKYKKNYQNYVVAITDKDSALWHLAKNKGYALLEIPSKVGGRFSIFSPVGLFPLAMIGIDIDQLIAGAQTMRERCLNFDIEHNPAAKSALNIFSHWKNGLKIHDLFLFSTDLESIGKWYRQLMGESLGKEFDTDRNQIHAGITPTISIGSTDLHSMAQLYLAGPYDKFTTFVKVHNTKTNLTVPKTTETNDLVAGIKDKPVHQIMNAILSGVENAFQKRKRPFMEIILPDKTENSIGQLLQMKMIEIMYLGYLLNINPFDQPNVEEYKIETKKILEAT